METNPLNIPESAESANTDDRQSKKSDALKKGAAIAGAAIAGSGATLAGDSFLSADDIPEAEAEPVDDSAAAPHDEDSNEVEGGEVVEVVEEFDSNEIPVNPEEVEPRVVTGHDDKPSHDGEDSHGPVSSYDPEPEPQSGPEPEPEPVPEPGPEPVPEPAPDPEPWPDTLPDPDPDPVPFPDPDPDPWVDIDPEMPDFIPHADISPEDFVC